ncbi:FMN-binding protein [Clostridium cylindrosporum]|uniref:Polyferredoxin n=1 Tax=Clostridium cylindrosporum DSM 605 TaxID=1121307 RepID=A0A0J8G6K2_CLOCY|nr:FMN-binding protein [Clostridium cylindrosporum]KMT23236.1 polyferredoxin [Clostridium cylindrosporum DSM 605]
MGKIQKIKIMRHIIQVIFLILFPGLITLAFSELKQIYLMIINGNFNIYNEFPILIEVLAIVPITIIFGRFFCGWICAFGSFNDYIYLISNKLFKIRFRVNEKVDSILKYFKFVVLLFIVVFIWTSGEKLFDTFSPWDAFAQIPQFSEAISKYTIGFILLGFIILGGMFVERFFCRYLCPLGAFFAIISRFRIFKINKPTEKCGSCKICTNNCSMGISLYKMEKVKSIECINCLQCVQVCPRKNAQMSICNGNINPVVASTVAITTLAGVYVVADKLGSKIASNNISDVSANNKVNGKKSITPKKAKYKDGTYTGVGEGFKPGLEVSVTVKNDKITSVEIVSNNETPKFAEKPFDMVPKEIIRTQSTKVDAVTGATMSSNGIMRAVENALQKASSSENKDNISQTAKYKDGTYTGVGEGFKPGLEVAVTIKKDKVVSIGILSNNETPKFSKEPFNVVPKEIITTQSTKVDAVTGATMTSNGIMSAVEDAMKKAQIN